MLSSHDDAETLEVLDTICLNGTDSEGHAPTFANSSSSMKSVDQHGLLSSLVHHTSHAQADRLLQSLQEHAPGNSIAFVSSGDAANLEACITSLAYGLAHLRQTPVVVVDAAGCLANPANSFTRLSCSDFSYATLLASDAARRCLRPGVYALSTDYQVTQHSLDCDPSLSALITSAANSGILCLVAAGAATSPEVTTFARLCSASVILHKFSTGTRQATLDAVHRLQLAGVKRLACVLVA